MRLWPNSRVLHRGLGCCVRCLERRPIATLSKSLAFAVAVRCAGCGLWAVGVGGGEPDVGWKIEK
jgi:hypothetical protein